jgi:MarR family transcriptional repressor of emrRAB
MSPTDPLLQERLEAVASTFGRARARGLDIPLDTALLFRTLTLLGRSLQQMVEEAIRPTGLGEVEFRVLMQLFARPEGSGHPGELCSGAAQSPASITRITDLLVARGLISRVASEQDRRRTVLQVTPAGDALVRNLVPQAFQPIGRLFAPFSAGQRAELQSLLGLVVSSVDEVHTQPQAQAAAGAVAGAA